MNADAQPRLHDNLNTTTLSSAPREYLFISGDWCLGASKMSWCHDIKQLLIWKRNAGEFTNRPRAESRRCHLRIGVFGAVAALDHASGGDCRW